MSADTVAKVIALWASARSCCMSSAGRRSEPDPVGAVTPLELERDVLRFITERYADRHLDIETAQLGLR